MKKLFISQSAIGAIAVLAWSLLGTVPAGQAANPPVNFIATDQPGPWFKCVGPGCVAKSVALTESLAIVPPNTEVRITIGTETNTVHTFTSLLWPVKPKQGFPGEFINAQNMPFDQHAAFRGHDKVTLVDPGLYVFVCKLHPFMLAATIVDDPATTKGLDLGDYIRLIGNNITVPTTSDLAARLLRAFFLITNPENYQNHDLATNSTRAWNVNLPAVPVLVTGGVPVMLNTLSSTKTLPELSPPAMPGVGEVWIDTEFEKTTGKANPGTATAVDAKTWKVIKKVALPEIEMNNPHNMWTDRNQTVIYQTQWFDQYLTVFNRTTGGLIRNIHVGEAPAHVMTRVDTDQVHVSLNGEDRVVEYNPFLAGNFKRPIYTQFATEDPAQPHAHWMSYDGKTMVTPNSNTNDSTRIDIPTGNIKAKTPTGTLPIATGMMPDASKYYVSNYLDSTITCISIKRPACMKGRHTVATKDIPLLLGGDNLRADGLANYDPISGLCGPVTNRVPCVNIGALPIQTPVSPDGKYVVTANTLSGTITIIDTDTDTLVKVLPCSAGCHGVNFGAKKGGGYYAYVSSKFSNDLIIVDLSTQTEAGRVLLVADPGLQHNPPATVIDATPTQYKGMGGQGVLPIPLVYNGWVQNLPRFWKFQLTERQRNPFPQDEHEHD